MGEHPYLQDPGPFLLTYWLPRNSQEAAGANFLGWVLFAACVLFTLYLSMTFTP